jgi:hypothetical protein
VVAVDHMRFSRIGGDDDKGNFHVCGFRFGYLLIAFEKIVNGGWFAEQVEIGVDKDS